MTGMPTHPFIYICIKLIGGIKCFCCTGVNLDCMSIPQKTCCSVLTEELSLRLRTSSGNRSQENVDKDKEKA